MGKQNGDNFLSDEQVVASEQLLDSENSQHEHSEEFEVGALFDAVGDEHPPAFHQICSILADVTIHCIVVKVIFVVECEVGQIDSCVLSVFFPIAFSRSSLFNEPHFNHQTHKLFLVYLIIPIKGI